MTFISVVKCYSRFCSTQLRKEAFSDKSLLSDKSRMNKEFSQGFFKKFDEDWRFVKQRFTEQLNKTDDLMDQNEKLKLKIQMLTEQNSKLEQENKTLKAEKELAESELKECENLKDLNQGLESEAQFWVRYNFRFSFSN